MSPVSVAMEEKQPAEYWIKHLGLVEHPGEEDGYFAVPFQDTFSVRNGKQVESQGRAENKARQYRPTCCSGGETGRLYCLFPAEEGRQSECQGKTGEG